jgi:hypothetical protein
MRVLRRSAAPHIEEDDSLCCYGSHRGRLQARVLTWLHGRDFLPLSRHNARNHGDAHSRDALLIHDHVSFQ